MSEGIPFDKVQIYRNQQLANLKLLKGKNSGSPLLPSSNSSDDKLMSSVVKRSQDRLKTTHLMLKTRLAKDLDETITSHLEQNPSIAGKFYIGIMMDDNYAVEVVKQEEAVQAVKDLPQAEAKERLAEQPVGYFKRADFTLKTTNEPAYKAFKAKLDSYFSRNREVIEYLKAHPENDVSQSDLSRSPYM